MDFKTYKVIRELLGDESSKKLSIVADIYGHIIFGRATILGAIFTLFLFGNAISGAIDLVQTSFSEGINFFDPNFIIKDYQGNCKTLIDDDFNIIDVKPVESWRPSSCISYNKFDLMLLVVDHQLASRRGFDDIFWWYLFFAIFYLLFSIHAATGSHFAEKVNITPIALSVGWIFTAIVLFPFSFRDHTPSASFERHGIEYSTKTVYLSDDNKMFKCPTPLFAKFGSHCDLDTEQW